MKEDSKEGVSFILESQTPTCGILKECVNYETLFVFCGKHLFIFLMTQIYVYKILSRYFLIVLVNLVCEKKTF